MTYLLGLMVREGEGVVVDGRGRVGNWIYTTVISPFVTIPLCNSRWETRLQPVPVAGGRQGLQTKHILQHPYRTIVYTQPVDRLRIKQFTI